MTRLTNQSELVYVEKHRPQIHFSPSQNWMNDPNGMVYFEGVYHLFYQYNPSDKVWDDMHWGHATSTDLISWKQHPIALHPDPGGLGYVFSGCAVVDWNNTAGLAIDGRPALIAIFTHSSISGEQVQSLAFSTDSGEHWTMYENNPVISNRGIADFRDPKVFWDDRSENWIMVLAANSIVQFFRSKNLLDWSHFHDFGEAAGSHEGVWECPDLFRLTVTDEKTQKWVLLVSMNPGGPNGGSATQYFIGDFDGNRFQAEHSDVLWMDYGPDNYAGVTWSDLPMNDGRKILIAWMSNWQYANIVPTEPWRGAMTIPRELSLIDTTDGPRLACKPVKEIESLRIAAPLLFENVLINSPLQLNSGVELRESLDLQVNVDSFSETVAWRIRFFNDSDEELVISFNVSDSELEVNRERAAAGVEPGSGFVSAIKAPYTAYDHRHVNLRIIKDASSIEVFSGQGLALFTVQYFVCEPLTMIEVEPLSADSQLILKEASIYELNSVWESILE